MKKIELLLPQYQAHVNTLKSQAASLGKEPEECGQYSSQLKALEAMLVQYKELGIMMKEYKRLLEKETERLKKASEGLAGMDEEQRKNFR